MSRRSLQRRRYTQLTGAVSWMDSAVMLASREGHGCQSVFHGLRLCVNAERTSKFGASPHGSYHRPGVTSYMNLLAVSNMHNK